MSQPNRKVCGLAVRPVVTATLMAFLAGCQSAPPLDKPRLDDGVTARTDAARVATVPSISFRSGDTLANAFRSMGLLDGHTYIVEGDATRALPGMSSLIYSSADLLKYFEAYNLNVTLTAIENSDYIRVKVENNVGAARKRAAKNCKVSLVGTVPIGPAMTDIAQGANVELSYADGGAAAYAGVLYPMGYNGNCAGALEYLGRKAELAVSFGESSVEYKMMDIATIDLGIPLRDRKIALDILADGKIGGSASGSTGSTSGGSTSGSGSTGSTGGSKSLQSTYTTNYFQSVKGVLDSIHTPFGTWNYIPETGQIFIRDRAEAVAAAKASLNRMAQAFQGRFEVTLTLYRMTSSKDRQISGSITKLINENLAAAFGAPSFALTKSTLSLNYDNKAKSSDGKTTTRTNIVQLLSEWGTIETLDTFSLTLQSGIPQTLKVANNTEYVRNVSTTTTANNSGVTATIEQANATDGAFVSMQARQAEAGKIAVDFGAFINRLDGFDETKTESSIVKSQRGFERTFDSMAIVDDGIPYVASIVSQKSRNDKLATLPGLEDTGVVGPLIGGSRQDYSAHTYIVVIVEARRQ